jgi:hypothetical protein
VEAYGVGCGGEKRQLAGEAGTERSDVRHCETKFPGGILDRIALDDLSIESGRVKRLAYWAGDGVDYSWGVNKDCGVEVRTNGIRES